MAPLFLYNHSEVVQFEAASTIQAAWLGVNARRAVMAMLYEVRITDPNPNVAMLYEVRMTDPNPNVAMLYEVRMTDPNPDVAMLYEVRMTDPNPDVAMLYEVRDPTLILS
eukprot:5651042-Prymnesium_polylepis.1